jgi:DNA-binding NarL/FixJ family response regulator
MSRGAESLRILVADNRDFVRRNICDLLHLQKRWKVVGEAANGVEAVKQARRLKPSVVIVDIEMPELDGLETTRRILQSMPQTKILALTNRPTESMERQVMEVGARGYVLKSEVFSELVKAVETVVQGGFFPAPDIWKNVALQFQNDPKRSRRLRAKPTSRQRQIIQLLAQGKVNKEIAAALNISVRTAETHRSTIMLKFGFHSMADLVRYALREGIVSDG